MHNLKQNHRPKTQTPNPKTQTLSTSTQRAYFHFSEDAFFHFIFGKAILVNPLQVRLWLQEANAKNVKPLLLMT